MSTSTGSTCGLRSGTLWCWGYNNSGEVGDGTTSIRTSPVRIGADSEWSIVDTGGFEAGFDRHTCGIRAAGELWCWGANSYGQLGLGDTAARTVPVRVGTGSTWNTVTLGAGFTCGVQTDSSLWCWGDGVYGKVGDGSATNRASPVRIGAATGWASVVSGYSHSCGLRSDRSAWCWGGNNDGRVGNGGTASVLAPVQVNASVRAVGVGVDHTFFFRWPTS